MIIKEICVGEGLELGLTHGNHLGNGGHDSKNGKVRDDDQRSSMF